MKKIMLIMMILGIVSGCSKSTRPNEFVDGVEKNEESVIDDFIEEHEIEKIEERIENELSDKLVEPEIEKAPPFVREEEERGQDKQLEAPKEEDFTEETPQPEPIPEEPKLITTIPYINESSGEFLAKFPDYHQVNLVEEGQTIAFWTDSPIQKFKYFTLNTEFDEHLIMTPEEVVFSTDVLEPEKPVVIRTQISDGLPSEGISFLDESGELRQFYIYLSEIDNSWKLAEF